MTYGMVPPSAQPWRTTTTASALKSPARWSCAICSGRAECNDRFAKLKANEEEVNRIFIDIYGLQDELTPEVEDKDVTVRKSRFEPRHPQPALHAVGCIFGRYSLDKPTFAYAGGEWDAGKYSRFQPVTDNVVPLCDEEYFGENDLVNRVVDFIREVFGAASLEENLAFIAKALGNKGNTSREVIRNYFLKDFFADHCKIYQKRPIYWMFDSGKKERLQGAGLSHRWDADTTGRVNNNYSARCCAPMPSRSCRKTTSFPPAAMFARYRLPKSVWIS